MSSAIHEELAFLLIRRATLEKHRATEDEAYASIKQKAFDEMNALRERPCRLFTAFRKAFDEGRLPDEQRNIFERFLADLADHRERSICNGEIREVEERIKELRGAKALCVIDDFTRLFYRRPDEQVGIAA